MVTHDPELAARAERNIHLLDGQVQTPDLPDTGDVIQDLHQLNGSIPLSAAN